MRSRNRGLLCALALALSGLSEAAAAVAPAVRPWADYRTIMWVSDSAYKDPAKIPLFFSRLREMGINTAMVQGAGNLQPLLDAKFPYYVENMVNRGLCLKWNSSVRDWDKFVTTWTAQGRPDAALVRDYCFDDPQWRKWASNEVRQLVSKNAPHKPLAYDLRDELSTTFSANPFDYDFNPMALEGFRAWLKGQYGTPQKLNAQWDTSFSSWAEVMPFTTDQIKNRMASGAAMPKGKPDWVALQKVRFELNGALKNPSRWNFSPWADFRTYMDISLARTLADLRAAATGIDPLTPVGIEGTQMPHAFGGYDLWRLSRVLDWVEPYDIGNAREIFGSFMPGKPILATVFERDTNHARRRLWHLLLQGDRGCIIWWSEDCIDWSSKDLELTPKGKALKPVLEEMTSPLARLFITAKKQSDPVFIHYSQSSIQAAWLIESTVDGSTWLRRFSSFEADHNHQVKVRTSWLKAFQDLGFNPRFISSEQIEAGELGTTAAVLVLPESWALSQKEVDTIKAFQRRSGAVFADGTPGVFDEHCKLRSNPGVLPWIQQKPGETPAAFVLQKDRTTPFLAEDVAAYQKQRLSTQGRLPEWIRENLPGLKPEISVLPRPNVRIFRFSNPGAQLVAFERNISYQMSEELKQAGGNESLEQPVQLEAFLSKKGHVYELRSGAYLGHIDRIHFKLDPWQPSLFAIASKPLPSNDAVQELLKTSPSE